MTSEKQQTLNLPDDVLERIFSYLKEVEWASACSLVCRQWRDVSVLDSLWGSACKQLWQKKAQVEEGQVFAFARFHASIEFSVKELKHILKGRGADFSNILEKSELRQAVTASEKFAPRLKIRQLPLYGKWKASYAFSQLDSTRTLLTENELLSMKFRFFFKSNPMEFASTAWFERDPRTRYPRFLMDPWPMPNVRDMPWKLNGNGSVSIHQFPAHMPFRRKDWSWGLMNDHVIFIQSNCPGYDEEEVRTWLLHTMADNNW